MSRFDAPELAGCHHLKLPVRDLQRSRDWYGRVLGYELAREFIEDGRLMGVTLRHPNGGPVLALRLEPERVAGASGFDYFGIGVAGKAEIDALAAHLDSLGEKHVGVHPAGPGHVLPGLRDPDGYEVRFYTLAVS
jgi:catechol 2,3-dioxygenase-like lactoylglutathione lyase family enzyme